MMLNSVPAGMADPSSWKTAHCASALSYHTPTGVGSTTQPQTPPTLKFSEAYTTAFGCPFVAALLMNTESPEMFVGLAVTSKCETTLTCAGGLVAAAKVVTPAVASPVASAPMAATVPKSFLFISASLHSRARGLSPLATRSSGRSHCQPWPLHPDCTDLSQAWHSRATHHRSRRRTDRSTRSPSVYPSSR